MSEVDFQQFVDVLRITNQEHLVELLNGQAGHSPPLVSQPHPTL